MLQVYRAYKPYVSVILHTPKKEKKEVKTNKKEVRSVETTFQEIIERRIIIQVNKMRLPKVGFTL